MHFELYGFLERKSGKLNSPQWNKCFFCCRPTGIVFVLCTVCACVSSGNLSPTAAVTLLVVSPLPSLFSLVTPAFLLGLFKMFSESPSLTNNVHASSCGLGSL